MPTRAHRGWMGPLRLLPACALLAAMSGCMGWKWVRPPATGPGGAPARFADARITRANGAVQVLRDVRVTADSVTGMRMTDDGRWARVSLPRAEVTVVERQSLNVFATALVAAGLAVVWLYTLLMRGMA